MEIPTESFDTNPDRVLDQAFRMAAAWERNYRSFLRTGFLPTEKDIPTLTGLSGLLGSEYRDLYYFLQTGSTGCLSDNRRPVLDRIKRILHPDDLAWRAISPTLEHLWGSFFGGRSIERNWPGFVILMPAGYVTSRHSFLQKGELTSIPKPEFVRVNPGPVLTLRFGRFWSQFDISVAVERIRLRVPSGRDPDWAKPVVRNRIRYYMSEDGRRMPSETIFQVGRAAPDDMALLERGQYYPNTEGNRVYGSDGAVCFTRGMTVLVLARLVPNPSQYSAIVHQLCVSLSPAADEVLDINCLHRSFAQFSKHYPGISQLINESLVR